MADIIQWDKPLNDEEDIQWEDNLANVSDTPYQVQTHNRGMNLQGGGAYQPKFAPTSEAPTMEYNPGGQSTEPYRNYSDQQLGAAAQGVDIDANAGVSTYRANFAAKKEQRDAIVAKAIKDAKGPDTPVRSGPESLSGDVEWYDADARRWRTAGDSASGMIPNALPAAGEIAGGIAGAVLPAPVLASAAGAGVGRGVGQLVKNKMGEAMGVEDDLRDQPSATSEGGKAFGLNLGLNTATSGLPAAWRLLTKGKDIVDVPTAKAILDSYSKNSKMVDDINNALAGKTDKRFTLSTGRQAAAPDPISGATNPQAANLVAREPILLATPQMADRMRERKLANESVLELFWMNEVENPHAMSNITQENWQNKMKQLYDAAKDGRLGPYQKAVDSALQQAEEAAKAQPQLGGLNTTKSGQIIRKVIQDSAQASKDKETAAWANYEQEAGYKTDETSSSYRVPVTPKIQATMASLKEFKKEALLDFQKTQAGRYQLNVPGKVSEEDQALLDDFDVDTNGGDMDLAKLDRTIKDLRKERSQSLRGQIGGDISDANRNRLLDNLVDARNDFVSKQSPEMQTALSEAEAETARHHAEFDRSFVGQFLVKDNAYELHVADADVIERIVRNKDASGAKELASMVNGEPGAKKAIMDYMYAYYNKHYTTLKDGVRSLDPNKHQLFKEEVLPYVKPFMDKADAAQIQEYGGFAKAMVRSEKRYKDAVDSWAKTDSGKLGQRLNTETFVNQFFQPSKSFARTNYAFIKNKLGEEGLEKTKAGIMSELTARARNPQTGRVDINKLSGLVMPIQDRLELYFGKETTQNINTYVRAAQAEQAQFTAGPSPTGSTIVSEASKFIFGPLSPENRKITFLKNLRVRSEAARLESALYDTNELPRLIKEIEGRRTSNAVKSATGAVGLSLFDQ